MQEMPFQSLVQEDLLEKEMATHSSILAWKIPWTEKPGGLQSIALQGVRHDWNDLPPVPVPLKRSHRHILPLRNGDYEQDDRSFPSLSPHVCMLSHFNHVWLFAALWTIACQAPLSMGFSRQKYCSGLPCPPLGDFPNPGIQPHLFCILHWQVGSWPLVPLGKSLISTQ